MTQITTNYTTYDLAYYYADLKRIPHLSREERQQLTASFTQTSNQDVQARNRLIEGHLNLATHIAIDRCPPSYYRLLPDILGEVAFTLVNITHRYDFQAGKDFTSYVIACADGAVKRAIGNDRPIRVPSSTYSKAKQAGTEQRFYDLQPESLDKLMQWYDTSELEEPPTAPLLPATPAPPRDPVLCAQVQEWFSYLSPRAQQVLSLRYGLSDENEHAHTTAEIAHAMGLSRHLIQYNEGHPLPRSMGIVASRKAARARARRLESPVYPHQEPVAPIAGESETVGEQQEPPSL